VRPSAEHEVRVEILGDLALLLGFTTPLQRLPCQLRPDVCLLNSDSGGIFIGDAKVSERPGCSATAQRFSRYLGCLLLSRFLLSKSICAICFGELGQREEWRNFLIETIGASGLRAPHARISCLDYPNAVVWASLTVR
jgi:hypothetical protein